MKLMKKNHSKESKRNVRPKGKKKERRERK
jgi:hypothetical protein